MRRNETAIKKTVHYLVKEKANYVNKIFNNFKKLYFDMKINLIDSEPILFNNLNRKTFQRLIIISLVRFKDLEYDPEKIEDILQEHPIDINTELKSFLRSCGNNLNDEEIEYMLHLVENFDNFEKNGKKLTYKDFYDIWGALIHFSSTKPDKIIEYVFENYAKDKEDLNSPYKKRKYFETLDIQKVSEFLNFYRDYFEIDQIDYIIDECKICFSKEFTLDAFSHMLISLRKYHTN